MSAFRDDEWPCKQRTGQPSELHVYTYTRGVKVFESRRLKEKCRRLITFYVLRAAPNMRDAKRRSCEGGFGVPPPKFF